MNHNINKKKIVMLFVMLGIMIIITTGVSFAYYLPKINYLENGSTVAFNSGLIAIDFDDHESQIEASGVLPGWYKTKTFSLIATNTTNIRNADAMNYSLKLIVEENTFSDNSIEVSLNSVNTSNNGTIAEIISGTLLSGPSEICLGFGSFDTTTEIGVAGARHYFELTVSFPERWVSQNNDMNKHLSAYITVEGADDLGTLRITDNYERVDDITIKFEKNKEINLLNLYKYPINRTLTIVSGDGTISSNKITLRSDEMNVSVNYPNIVSTISSLDKEKNGLEIDPTDDANLRYVGANPKNYIIFNGEIWRIIGLFDTYNVDSGQTEKLVKIIRNDSLGNYSWDSSESSINSGYGVNEWSQADIMTELNIDYLDTSKTSGTTTWYNGSNNSKTATYDYSKNIKSSWVDKIANVRWNTNRVTYGSSALNTYNQERSTTLISTPSDGIARNITWDGKIGLMYPSDYGYASTDSACRSSLVSSNCKNINWLPKHTYQWTLSPYSGSARTVFYVNQYGYVVGDTASSNLVVYPVLFLKSNVVISGGTGAKGNPYIIDHRYFWGDSWQTIATNVRNGNSSLYNVGDTKTVSINGTNYKVRVANNSTPAECGNDDFSKTACGFEIEFEDIVEQRAMNRTQTNVGGWASSEMRTYLNGNFYNNLPTDLKSVITDTQVISGHGSTSGESNFTTTDKIYLLSGHEVYEALSGNNLLTRDTAYNNTRQLDYYQSNRGLGAIKNYSSWWLRTAYSSNTTGFLGVYYNGTWSDYSASSSLGVSPAFRIG